MVPLQLTVFPLPTNKYSTTPPAPLYLYHPAVHNNHTSQWFSVEKKIPFLLEQIICKLLLAALEPQETYRKMHVLCPIYFFSPYAILAAK